MTNYGNFIAGEWRPLCEAGENRNPSERDDVIGQFARGTAKDVAQAVAAAREAFVSWSRSSPQLRHDILRRAATEIESRQEELADVLAREEGKLLAEARGEVGRAAQVMQFFAGEALRLSGDALDSVRPGVDVLVSREPLGVVGLITPWNFPIAIPAWKIAPALAYGNCVVLKPADLVPHSAWMLVDILARAGLPTGVLNLVMGRGSEVGQAMVEHSGIDAISFTGSEATGRSIAADCVAASPMKKVQLEMGGKNPLVVLDDADLDLAVACALDGAFFSTGQRCTASSRLIVTEGIHDAFVARLIKEMQALRPGDARDPRSKMGPVVSQGQLVQNQDYLRIGRGEGAELIGGEVPEDAPGHFMAPALFTGARNDMRICREEIFGPIASVIRVADYDEALAVANDTVFGLSAGICTSSLVHATDFRKRAEAGMVMVNLPTAGVDYHVPFGGRKGSSYGAREQGSYAREFYTVVKTSYTRAV